MNTNQDNRLSFSIPSDLFAFKSDMSTPQYNETKNSVRLVINLTFGLSTDFRI